MCKGARKMSDGMCESETIVIKTPTNSRIAAHLAVVIRHLDI